MSFFSKVGGALKRAVRSKLLQAGMNLATSGLSGKVLSVAKQLGATVGGGRTAARQSKSNAVRLAVAGTPPIMPSPDIGPLQVKRTADYDMSAPKWYGAMKTVSKKRRTKKEKPAKSKKEKPTKPKSKRKPPPGGLDLAAMAAAWKKAGKPGTWINWIKTKPIRRS